MTPDPQHADLLASDLADQARAQVAESRRGRLQVDLTIGLSVVWGAALAGLAAAELLQVVLT